MKLQARAKINLSLDVLGEREDGYHELRTVMAEVRSLYDTVYMETAEAVTVGCTQPLPEQNTAVRAARLFRESFGCGGARIHIEKQIPSQAGLGGASADAAAVLRGMQSLYGYPAREEQLYSLAARVGADVPFCLHGGVCLCEGIGEKIKELEPCLGVPVVLLKGEGGVSTGELFRSLPPKNIRRRFHALRVPLVGNDTRAMLAALRSGSVREIANALHNELQAPAVAHLPEIEGNLSALRGSGALGVSMSGSGSCVFGVFADMASARSAALALCDSPFVFCGEI